MAPNSTLLNSTELGFSSVQRGFLTVYTLVMAVMGVLGNSTVLIASVRYNAIRLDRISLFLVQNLAVADVLYSFCVIVPQTITLMLGSWKLGDVLCFVSAEVGIIPVSANTLTVLTITAYRLKMVFNPFDQLKIRTARMVVAACWVLALVPIAVFTAYHSKASFHSEKGRCLTDIYENTDAKVAVLITMSMIVMLPLFSITALNTVLLGVAWKHRAKSGRKEEGRSYQALVMVCALSGLFTISWTPYIIYTFLKMRKAHITQSLDLMSFNCIFLNSFGNPILYTITNKRFGNFVKSAVQSVICCFRKEKATKATKATAAVTQSTTLGHKAKGRRDDWSRQEGSTPSQVH